MIATSFIDIEFVMVNKPDTYYGKLHLDKEHCRLEVNTGQIHWHQTETLEAVFITNPVNKDLYTAVHCTWRGYLDGRQFYEVQELWAGTHVEEASKPTYNLLTASVLQLTYFLNPRLISSERKADRILIEARNNAQHKFALNETYTLHLEAFHKINMQRQQTVVTTDSLLKIEVSEYVSRQQLFSVYSSFLYFYMLFLTKLPATSFLQFSNAASEITLENLPVEENEDRTHIVLKLEEIDNYGDMLQHYFQHRTYLDKVVALWSVTMTPLSAEIKFLQLTQSLETFHRSVYEQDSTAWERVKTALKTQDPKWRVPNQTVWLQIMRYHHLLDLLEQENPHLRITSERYTFLETLVSSRNFYTHHEKKKRVWSPFELLDVNRKIRKWMRFLVLWYIGLSPKLFYQLNGREEFFPEDFDIYQNKYSMRFKTEDYG